MPYVNKVHIGSTDYLIEPTLFATTSGTSSAYTASITGFETVEGAAVQLQFNTDNAANATLSINSATAKNIKYDGANITANLLHQDHTYNLVYDGSAWQLVGDIASIEAVDENVKQTPTTTNADYELLFSESANNNPLTEGARKTNTLTYNPSTKILTINDGTLSATAYSGNAANITGILNLANMAKGDANTALMGQGSSTAPAYVSVSPSISITAGTSSNAPKINLSVLGISGTAQELTKASTSVYGATKLYDGVDSDSTSLAATANAVKTAYDTAIGVVAAADALTFKGTLSGGDPTTTYTPAADCGDTYKVEAEGLINGIPVEVGDLLICTTDETAQATSSNYNTVKGNWVIVQNNVDGAVFKGANAFVNNEIILADQTTGKVKSSGKTLSTTAPSSSSTDAQIPTAKAVWTVFDNLDVSTITANCSPSKTLAALSQTNGLIAATLQDIAISLTADSTDGLWDITGTNNNTTNTVSYSIAPYSTQQNTASFDTSSTDPTLTTRLNYNGHLYATAFSAPNMYIGSNSSYGDAYTPIYWNNGVPATVTTIQKATFSLTTSNSGVATINTNTASTSRVIQIVVDSGFSYLKSTVNWAINSDAIQISATVDGTVGGYILYIK